MVTIYTNEDGCSSFGVPAEWANFPEVDYCEGILPPLHWSGCVSAIPVSVVIALSSLIIFFLLC